MLNHSNFQSTFLRCDPEIIVWDAGFITPFPLASVCFGTFDDHFSTLYTTFTILFGKWSLVRTQYPKYTYSQYCKSNAVLNGGHVYILVEVSFCHSWPFKTLYAFCSRYKPQKVKKAGIFKRALPYYNWKLIRTHCNFGTIVHNTILTHTHLLPRVKAEMRRARSKPKLHVKKSCPQCYMNGFAWWCTFNNDLYTCPIYRYKLNKIR